MREQRQHSILTLFFEGFRLDSILFRCVSAGIVLAQMESHLRLSTYGWNGTRPEDA